MRSRGAGLSSGIRDGLATSENKGVKMDRIPGFHEVYGVVDGKVYERIEFLSPAPPHIVEPEATEMNEDYKKRLWPIQTFIESVPEVAALELIEMREDLKDQKIPEYNQSRSEAARELYNGVGMNQVSIEYLDEFAAVCGIGVTAEEKAEALKVAKAGNRGERVGAIRRRG